jgi:uncharacterized protein (TIGR03118 family)
MNTTRWYFSFLAINACALVLSGCGSGSDSPTSSPMTTAATPAPAPTTTSFTNIALVSNTTAGTVDTLPANTVAPGDPDTFTFPQTKNPSLDPHLSHGWGVAFGPGSAVWVNDHASNLSSLYDGDGNVIPPSEQPAVAIPPNASGGAAGPTGIVANIDTIHCPTITAATCSFGTGFSAGASPAEFIFVGTGGTLSAWATGSTAITEFDGSANGDSFTGLAIYTQSTGLTYLLATDFRNGEVDVFDSSFTPSDSAFTGDFRDPNLPPGYAPFGIQTIGNLIYVTYAKQPSTPGPEVDGEGLGLVDVFDGTGTLVKQLIAVGGPLNAPWGVAMAPQGFGSFGGDLLVANFGNGRINVFDPSTGAMLGTLMDTTTGNPIHIPGLWGIAFGNGALNQSTTTLYYAASPDMKTQGLYGSISPTASSSGSSPPPNPTGY